MPRVVTNQGEEVQKLSELRRKLWISTISITDLTESVLRDGWVCGKHFTSARAAKPWDSYNPDWVPSLYLGHSKNISGEKLETMLDGARKGEIRARNFDQKRAKYERLEEEIMAKRLKIDEAWSEIQEVGMATQTEESQYLFVSETWEAIRRYNNKVSFYTCLPGFDVVIFPDMSIRNQWLCLFFKDSLWI